MNREPEQEEAPELDQSFMDDDIDFQDDDHPDGPYDFGEAPIGDREC